ncbi:hypothetical protein GEMRC1_003087 [Eukaryota sp. GEM-RC1]
MSSTYSKLIQKKPNRILFPKWICLLLLFVFVLVVLVIVEFFTHNNEFEKQLPGAFSAAFGWFALLLTFLQVPLGTRFRPLERVIGLDHFWLYHRYLPIAIFLTVGVHAYLKVAAFPFPMSLKDSLYFWFYPNTSNAFFVRVFHGQIALFGMILLTLITAFRKLPVGIKKRFSYIPYKLWRTLHILFYILIIACLPHVWTSTRQSVYRSIIFSLISCVFFYPLFSRIYHLISGKSSKKFRVSSVNVFSDRSTQVLMTPEDLAEISNKPAAFVILSNPTSSYPLPHPLSIASLPGSYEHELLISGNSNIGKQARRWQPGQVIKIDGYYGVFGKDLLDKESIVLCAGGCGLAPISSLLKYLNHCKSFHKIPIPNVKVLMSFRNVEDVLPIKNDLVELRMSGSSVFCLCFSDPRLQSSDLQSLDQLTVCSSLGRISRTQLDLIERNDDVYLCGPKPLVKSIIKFAKEKGVKSAQIHFEEFIM